MAKDIIRAFFLFVVSVSAFGGNWEENEGAAFSAGNVAEVKKILSQTPYSGDLLIQALEYSAMSGNVDLVKFLEKKGWLEICRKDKRCNPVYWAVISKKNPGMIAYLLSRGFKPTIEALYSASAQVAPDDDTVLDSLNAVKVLCDAGVNPLSGGPQDKRLSGELIALEQSQTQNFMDLGSPLRAARGKAAQAVVIDYLKSGACKKGSMASTYFDNYLATVESFRRGENNASAEVSAPNPRFQPLVETYLIYESLASANQAFLEHLKRHNWISRCLNNVNCRPIDVASETGANQKTLEFLAAEGFDVDSRNSYEGTPLMYATLNANVNAVKFLCERGADFRKQVKLGIYERSIISILRRSYSGSWCSAVIGNYPASIQEKVNCWEEGGPQGEIAIPECVPGNSCRAIAFPPRGEDKVVRELRALTEIFHYFKTGQCNPAQSPPSCTATLAPKAAIISENLNLRTMPSSASAKLETLAFGTVIKVIDSTSACEALAERAGRWIKVKVLRHSQPSDGDRSKAEGWIFDAYVDYFPSFEP